ATSIVLLAKIIDINAALAGLTYTPPTNTSGTATLTITTNDLGNTGSGGPKSDTDTTSLIITPVNDPPVNLLPNTALTAGLEVMKTGKVKFSAADGNPIVVSDVDITDPNMQQVEVALSVDDPKGRLKLGGVTGITIVSGADNTPALTIRGTLT